MISWDRTQFYQEWARLPSGKSMPTMYLKSSENFHPIPASSIEFPSHRRSPFHPSDDLANPTLPTRDSWCPEKQNANNAIQPLERTFRIVTERSSCELDRETEAPFSHRSTRPPSPRNPRLNDLTPRSQKTTFQTPAPRSSQNPSPFSIKAQDQISRALIDCSLHLSSRHRPGGFSPLARNTRAI